MIQEYKMALKDVIHESCEDGITSALDFSLNDYKMPDPVRARAKVTLWSQFLSYATW
jgi:cyanate lyase